jgi:hypothetical protein
MRTDTIDKPTMNQAVVAHPHLPSILMILTDRPVGYL